MEEEEPTEENKEKEENKEEKAKKDDTPRATILPEIEIYIHTLVVTTLMRNKMLDEVCLTERLRLGRNSQHRNTICRRPHVALSCCRRHYLLTCVLQTPS